MQCAFHKRIVSTAAIIITGAAAITAMLVPGNALRAQDDSWAALKAAANRQAKQGNFQGAGKKYLEALESAQTPKQRVKASLDFAAYLQDRESGPAATLESLKLAASLFNAALKEATGMDRLVASNNYAALLVDLDRGTEAVDLLEGIAAEMERRTVPVERATYRYTYGRALEQAGRLKEALRKYREAVRLDPGFRQTAEAALRLTEKIGDVATGIDEFSRIVDTLVERKLLHRAATWLRTGLSNDRWVRDAAFNRFFLSLIRYYTVAKLGRGVYAKEWQPRLDGIAGLLKGHAVIMRADLSELYMGDLRIQLRPQLSGEYRRRYSHWATPARPNEEFLTFAKFVRTVGDAYLQEGDLRAAIQRYGLAWLIQPKGSDGALYLANVLLIGRQQVDPDGNLLRQVVFELFSEKSGAYRRQDKAEIVRLHTILGQIFQRQGRFGPPHDPQSAVFQWERAVRFQREISRTEVDAAAATPGLYTELARAYVGLRDNRMAWKNYIAAAEGYLAHNRRESAQIVWSETQDLQTGPPSNLQNRHDFLDRRLR